jgi:hypothetical protein
LEVLITTGSARATQSVTRKIAPQFLLDTDPGAGGSVCGIQFMTKPPRDTPCGSPASLEIMTKVLMHMKAKIVWEYGNASAQAGDCDPLMHPF